MKNPFPTPAPDFSDPLGLLRACHERILGHCTLFLRLREHIARHGIDSEADAALGRARRYFSEAAPHHHADEEQDLFPLLARQDPTLARLTAELAEQHHELDAQWERLAPLLSEPTQADPDALLAAAEGFARASRAHVERENTELLPAAARLLTPEQLVMLGDAMARRRHSNR